MSDEVLYYGADIINSKAFQKMNKFMQHGDTTTLEHSINVAEVALRFVKKYNIKVVLGSDSHSAKYIDKYEINI